MYKQGLLKGYIQKNPKLPPPPTPQPTVQKENPIIIKENV
jgi:hypothetical protein